MGVAKASSSFGIVEADEIPNPGDDSGEAAVGGWTSNAESVVEVEPSTVGFMLGSGLMSLCGPCQSFFSFVSCPSLARRVTTEPPPTSIECCAEADLGAGSGNSEFGLLV